jgi:hypothetical protein
MLDDDEGQGAAEPAVIKFHQQFNEKQFAQIYAESSDKMKEAASEKELVDLLEAVHRKLGTVKDAKSTSWYVNTTPLGTMVTLTYEIEFSQDAKGTEQFIYEVSGETATLVNYNINSPQLVTR